MFNWKKKNFLRRHYRRGYNFYRRQNFASSSRQSSSRRSVRNNRLNKRINFSKIIIFIFLLVFIYIVYYFFYSPNFKITDIEIRGRENISEYALRNIIEEQFDKSRFLIFNQSNILMFNKRLARKNIKNSYVLDKLVIEKEYPHKLYIEIEEKVSTVVWVSQRDSIEHYYYLDLNGVVLGEIPISEIERLYAKEKINIKEGEDLIKISKDEQIEEKEEEQQTILPLIYDQSNSEVKIKEPVLESGVINFIIDLYQEFPEDFSEINIKNFATLKPNTTQIHLITEGGYEIYFESAKDLEFQLHNLKIVLEDKIQDTSKIQYIDLRFNDRVYYK